MAEKIFNLQRFATTPQPLNTTGDAALAPEMKTFYERTLLERLLEELVYAQFGQKRGIPKRGGKTIEFRRFSSLPMDTFQLTEGVTPTGQKLAVTAITATVVQYGNYVVITDVLDLTAFDPVLDETSELLGEQAGLFIDTLVRDTLMTGTNVLYAKACKYNDDAELVTDASAAPIASRTAITNMHAMSVDTIRMGKKIMQRNKVKPYRGDKKQVQTGKGEFVCVVHTDAVYDLQSSKKWIDVDVYGKQTGSYSGEVGKIYGVRIVATDNGKIWAAAGAGDPPANVYGAIMLGGNAFGIIDVAGSGNTEFIYKGLGSGGTEDPLNQRQTSGWKVMFTTKILEELAVLRIEHGHTEG